ncbi:MAG: hypothetical protein F4003_05300 [Acidimicrobiaceae bacterium]|nr:hypothetical protein [Acidimicrobiaceae bacterium]MYC41515.1 hypothetical protein [Acidimicrobiaceae bacterium]
MAAHEFLSPDWIRAVKQIRDELELGVQETDLGVRANVTIVDAPFEVPVVLGHLDTNSGTLILDEGHLGDADFGIEMPYSLAYEIFVERDPAAVVPVLLGGQVKLTGDSSMILLLADAILVADLSDGPAQGLGSTTSEMVKRIDAITLR